MGEIFGHHTSSRATSKALTALGLIIILAVVSAGAYVLIVNYPPNTGSTPTPNPSTPSPPAIEPTATPTASATPAPATQPTPTVSPTAAPTVSPTPSSLPQPTISPTPTSTPSPTPPNTTPTPTPAPTTPKYSLSEAISAGYVEANITGYSDLHSISGYSSGPCVRLNINRLVSYTIEIGVLPTGTLLTTSTAAQNMAVLKLIGLYLYLDYYEPCYRIILDETGWQQYIFEGYCVNFHKGNPTSSTLFTLSGMADDNVLKIFGALDQLPSNVTTVGAIQTAVSVVTDNISQSELKGTWPDFVSEIPKAKTILQSAGIDISNVQLFK